MNFVVRSAMLRCFLRPIVAQQRFTRFNLTKEGHIPYQTREEITTEKSRDPHSWDVQDMQRPHLDEPDTLYNTIEIETRGHDDAVLSSYEKFLLTTLRHLNITVSNVFQPRIIKGKNTEKIFWRRTLLRSAFVHKKKRTQYETRTYWRNVQVKHLTGSTADTLLEYTQRMLPEGVAMRVTKKQVMALPEFLKPPTDVRTHKE